MQMGSSKTLPVQELPGLEEFHCVISPGMALFRDIPCLLGGLAESCLAACEFGGAGRAPHVTALGSCKEASVLMATFIQKLTLHPIKHHPEPEGQVLMSLCLELNRWHFMGALSPQPEGLMHLICISTKETLLM